MSRFDKIFEARETESLDTAETITKAPAKKISHAKINATAPKQDSVASSRINNAPAKQPDSKRGRPPAKRSDPDFVGLTTYVRRNTHTKAKIALLQEGKGRELSELVEDLISDWLNKK